MSQTAALTGNDTIKINGRIIRDLADGDCAVLEHPNDIAAVKTGKNGNSLYAMNETGRQCEVTLRVLRGSEDDKFLNQLLAIMKNNFPAFVLMNGEFAKNIGDGAGNITQDIFIMTGGVFKKNVNVMENVEGGTDQAVSVYNLVFSNAPRTIG